MGMGGRAGTPQKPDPDFIPALWNDFAARMLWSVTPNYKDANHKPAVKISGPLDITAAPGTTVELAATKSDPDGNQGALKWWRYKSQSTYTVDIVIAYQTAMSTSVQVPADAKPGQAITIMAEATDNGKPMMTHYQQLVFAVR